MQHALRHGEALLRTQLDGSTLEIDDELSFNHVKELVLIVMLVPMEITVQHAKPDNAIIDLAQGLVEPLVFGLVLKRLHIDELERLELYIGMNRIRRLILHVNIPLRDSCKRPLQSGLLDRVVAPSAATAS